jgi:hypothetical protein
MRSWPVPQSQTAAAGMRIEFDERASAENLKLNLEIDFGAGLVAVSHLFWVPRYFHLGATYVFMSILVCAKYVIYFVCLHMFKCFS